MPSRARFPETPLAALLVLPLLLATVACAPSDDVEGDAPGAGSEAEEAATDAPASDELWLGEVRVGSAVDPEGAVTADRETDRFAPGDSIYASMSIDGAPANAAVHAVFYDGAGEKIAEDEKKVPAEASYLYFDAGDTSNWLPGEYRVEVAVDGRVHSRKEITVAEGAPSEPTESTEPSE